MSNFNLTKDDINENVLVSDFLIGMGSTFFGQDNDIRQFLMYPNGRDNPYLVGFVDMVRNEWVCTNPQMGGKVTDLAEKVFSLILNDETLMNIYKIACDMENMPKPSKFMLDSSDKVQVAVDVYPIGDHSILQPLFYMGISEKVAFKYMMEGAYKGIRDGKEHHKLLFPNSNGGYYSLSGNGWRVVGKEGISLIGPMKDTQRLCVFDNPIDFLALQQKRSTNGTDMFFNNDRFLIINGKNNLDDALGHIATHPHYYNVCYFFPITDKGVADYWKIYDICPEKIVDSSRLYSGHDSFADSLDYDIRCLRGDGVFSMQSKMKAADKRQEEQAQEQTSKKQSKEQEASKADIAKVNAGQKSETKTKPREIGPNDDSQKSGIRL